MATTPEILPKPKLYFLQNFILDVVSDSKIQNLISVQNFIWAQILLGGRGYFH